MGRRSTLSGKTSPPLFDRENSIIRFCYSIDALCVLGVGIFGKYATYLGKRNGKVRIFARTSFIRQRLAKR